MKNVPFCDADSQSVTLTDSLRVRATRFQTFFIHPISGVGHECSPTASVEIRGPRDNTAETRSACSSVVVVGANCSREREM
jgi:hypothetical protein